jgi:hypothetical protein
MSGKQQKKQTQKQTHRRLRLPPMQIKEGVAALRAAGFEVAKVTFGNLTFEISKPGEATPTENVFDLEAEKLRKKRG